MHNDLKPNPNQIKELYEKINDKTSQLSNIEGQIHDYNQKIALQTLKGYTETKELQLIFANIKALLDSPFCHCSQELCAKEKLFSIKNDDCYYFISIAHDGNIKLNIGIDDVKFGHENTFWDWVSYTYNPITQKIVFYYDEARAADTLGQVLIDIKMNMPGIMYTYNVKIAQEIEVLTGRIHSLDDNITKANNTLSTIKENEEIER